MILLSLRRSYQRTLDVYLDLFVRMKRNVSTSLYNRKKSNKPYFIAFASLSVIFVISLIFGGVELSKRWNHKEELSKDDFDYLIGLVQKVNNAPDLGWRAKYNPFAIRKIDFNYKSEKNSTAIQEDIDLLVLHSKSSLMREHIRRINEFQQESLPESFDARMHWPYCSSISYIPNQGACGSCYAVAAASVASDRACIASNGTIQVIFSEEDILGCCQTCGNCYGGDPLKAMVYWARDGLVSGGRDGCRPYSVDLQCGIPCSPATYPSSEGTRVCHKKCQSNYYWNSYEEDKHHASIAYSMYPRTTSLDNSGKRRVKMPTIIGIINETSAIPLTTDQIRDIIKTELYLWGPTTMALPVTEEFLHYKGGVFSPYPVENFRERIVYWHVVRLIGWGQDKRGKHYWLAVNSFGKYWGEYGTFRINPEMIEKFGLEYETALP